MWTCIQADLSTFTIGQPVNSQYVLSGAGPLILSKQLTRQWTPHSIMYFGASHQPDCIRYDGIQAKSVDYLNSSSLLMMMTMTKMKTRPNLTFDYHIRDT